jgi:UDPglucose 6-dehydrogenase
MRVGVIGVGYVGLVTGTCLADTGHTTVCYDLDTTRIDRLRRGETPIFEPGLADLLRRNRDNGRLAFTTSLAEALAGADLSIIAVGTPSGEADNVIAAARAIAEHGHAPRVVVVKSTAPVGTCEAVRAILGPARHVVANPEFLREGRAVDDFMRPDRIVVGADSDEAAAVLRALYAPFVRNGHPIAVMSSRSAEMTKYAANAMLAARVSLMNELALICEAVGADVNDVRRGVGTDKRIGMDFLYAGLGFGGSCLPKDTRALARLAEQNGARADILGAVIRVNDAQHRLFAERILGHFGGSVAGRQLALWGLAFKPQTDDVREAPALSLIEHLTAAGADIRAYDPEARANAERALAKNTRVSFAAEHYEALDGADALVIATEWSVFRAPDFRRVKEALRAPVIFDGRNLYDPAELRALGFTYVCIGRPA